MAKKSKNLIAYSCSACGHREAKWLGRCPECGEWNTFQESMIEESAQKTSHREVSQRKTQRLSEVPEIDGDRIGTGIAEVDRVLGGGMVPGASVLLGGEPGIGKSTLLLHIAGSSRTKGPTLYISGEESAAQIKLRANRLGADNPGIHLLCDPHLETILPALERLKPGLIIVDSVQTLVSHEAGSVPGTVNQLKYCTYEIIDWAKERGVIVFLIAHITKEGLIAGPKVLEHMVDTVLFFEQGSAELRFLRPTKNRFGSVDEIGLFMMSKTGLNQVPNPSSLFMVQRQGGLPPGTVLTPVYEGSRVLLVEIQALSVPSKGGMSRVYSDRIDNARVSRIAAVLEKHVGIRFSDQDVYVNVAGGLRIAEVGVELALALALASARTGIALPAQTVVSGEISLAGEVLPVPYLGRRIKAASDTGYKRFIVPSGLHTTDQDETEASVKGLVRVTTVREAMAESFGTADPATGDT